MWKACSVVLALCAAVAVASCESSGGGGGSGSYGGGRSVARAGSGESFSAGDRATMEVAWKAFKNDSPGWPALREDWIAIGPKAVNTLTENLFRAMTLARLGNYPEGYDRARKELIYLGEAAMPTLAGILEDPGWTDPRTGETQALPTEVVNEVAELLLIVGSPAAPHLAGLLRSETPAVRRACAEALGRLGDPAGRDPLVRMLRSSPDWIDRMTAAKALGYMSDAPATGELVEALDDADSSVAMEAARALARLGATTAIPALDRRRERARADGDGRLAAACGSASAALRRPR